MCECEIVKVHVVDCQAPDAVDGPVRCRHDSGMVRVVLDDGLGETDVQPVVEPFLGQVFQGQFQLCYQLG